MLQIWTWTMGSVIVISLMAIVGILTVILTAKKLRQTTLILVGLSVGALFGDAFIHLIPEAFSEAKNSILVSFYILLGIAVFFILEKFLKWHHHHHGTHTHEYIEPFGYLNLFSDGIHNLIDGFIVGVAYLISIPVGIATTVTVILHEIPQEMGDFGLLIHAGFSKRKALALNLLTALVAIIGAVIALLIGTALQDYLVYALALAAGGFIYVAGADLVPEMHKTMNLKDSLLQFIAGGFGIAIMFLLLFI